MKLTRKQRWAKNNRKLINKRARERYKVNSEARKASAKKYQDEHKEEEKLYNKLYYKNNISSIKNNHQAYRDAMPDSYIKRLVVCQAPGLAPKDIPDEIVLAKKNHLKVTRYLRKLEKTKGEDV